MRSEEFLLIVCLLLIARDAVATTYGIYPWYTSSTCSGTPGIVVVQEYSSDDSPCVGFQCDTNFQHRRLVDGGASDLAALKGICSSDYTSAIQDLFGNSPYIMWMTFEEHNCSDFDRGVAIIASGSCQTTPGDLGYVVASLNADGSGTMSMYKSQTCEATALYKTYTIPAADLRAHSCDSDGYRWYSSNDVTAISTKSASPGLKMGAFVGIIAAGIVLILAV